MKKKGIQFRWLDQQHGASLWVMERKRTIGLHRKGYQSSSICSERGWKKQEKKIRIIIKMKKNLRHHFSLTYRKLEIPLRDHPFPEANR